MNTLTLKAFIMAALCQLFTIHASAADPLNIVIIGQSNAYFLADAPSGIQERFAQEGLEVNIIKCAKGGTPIAQFQQNWAAWSIYGKCMQDIAGRQVDGVIFWQGEADSKTKSGPVLWARDFTRLISALRADLNNPRLPVVMAMLNGRTHAYAAWWITMRMAQSQVFAPNLIHIDTNNALFQDDDVHLTPDGYHLIGRDFAEALLPMLQAPLGTK